MSLADEIVIFDINGTLADVSERIRHVKQKPKNWKTFFGGMAQDKPIRSMVRLCNLLYDAGIQSFCVPAAVKSTARKQSNGCRSTMSTITTCRSGGMATVAAMWWLSVKSWPAWTRAKFYSRWKIAAGWSRCGARKGWSVCSARRVSSSSRHQVRIDSAIRMRSPSSK